MLEETEKKYLQSDVDGQVHILYSAREAEIIKLKAEFNALQHKVALLGKETFISTTFPKHIKM